MSLYAGLDISVKTTAICVVDGNGQILLETVVDSSPNAIADRLRGLEQPLERIGLEAGPLSQWIYGGLVDIGLAAICVETRHMHAFRLWGISVGHPRISNRCCRLGLPSLQVHS